MICRREQVGDWQAVNPMLAVQEFGFRSWRRPPCRAPRNSIAPRHDVVAAITVGFIFIPELRISGVAREDLFNSCALGP